MLKTNKGRDTMIIGRPVNYPMNSDAPLCKELYRVLLLNPNAQEHRLSFGPSPSSGDEHYLLNEDEYMRETFCPTKTLLSVFKESHDLIADFQSKSLDCDTFDLYLLTLGNLLAAPGNHTALNLHERTFLEKLNRSTSSESLLWLGNEILLIERFLTSTNNRLNKSSSLWYLYRKLLILARAYRCDDLNYKSTILHSGRRHFSNYYCWATARWLYDVVPVAEKAQLLDLTCNFCFETLSDASSWSALSYMICQQRRKSDYNYSDYKHLRELLKLPINDIHAPSWPSVRIEQYVTKIIQTIDAAVAEEWPPFLCLMTVAKEVPEAADLAAFSHWRENIRKFEQQHGKIASLRNNPVVPTELSDDALLHRNARHFGFKKLFLAKIQN